jgi:hypothetical protein
MAWEKRRHWPAMVVATLALVVALGGSVYAASRIDGHSLRVKSLPGNRLVPGSVPANRLRPGTIEGDRLAPGSVTGHQIDASTLGPVPEAAHATSADSARHADTAMVADYADEAQRLDGHVATCGAGTVGFAGNCWQSSFATAAVTAPEAAAACAEEGGELPAPLALAAFAAEPGASIAPGGEWTNDIPSFTGLDAYSVATVMESGQINAALSTATKKFRCVIPLVT